MRIKRTLGVIAAAILIMVTACGNAVDENVEKENTPAQESSVPVEPTESASDEQIEEPAAEANTDYRVVSGGPYGQISILVPNGWEYIVCPVDDDQMSYGLYGRLDPGTYKITKNVMAQKDDGSDSNPNYPLSAQFMIADSDVVRTYEVTDGNRAEELIANNQLLTMVRYYEMADGTWKTDECAYKYRLEITGRMGGAVKDSTFVYLSNVEDISFDQAWKAAGLSSSIDDYFDRKDAVLVAMK